jgi:ferric-dicitrate binding protein FerR (iron transport regulator)
MKWLESPRNEAERRLREGLDQATERTGDEITHRRVWAKIAETTEGLPARSYGRLALASVVVMLLCATGVLSYRYLRGESPASLAMVRTNPAVPPNAETTAREGTASVPVDQVAVSEAERAPGHRVRTGAGERARVALGGGAEAELDENSAITWDSQHRPSVEGGSARLSVPHQPPGWRFSVTAGPYVVTVVGTKFEVRVAGHSVGVEVTEGIVEVWHGSHSTRLVAGDSWHGPLNLDESTPAQPSVAPEARSDKGRAVIVPATAHGKPALQASQSLLDARAAVQAGNASKAVEILSHTAQGSGPAAENAAYELAWIARYNLNRPRQAVALWEKYRTRFPSGLLRAEADLSIVETLSHVGDVRGALSEAESFISRYPDSERRPEVQRLAERLRGALGASDSR